MRVFHTAFVSALALIASVGCQQKEYFMPAPTTLTPDAQFVKSMKAKTGGDISKLTPEEKAKMDKITRGFTKEALSAPEIKHDN